MDANTIIQLSNMAVTDFLFVIIQTANGLAAVHIACNSLICITLPLFSKHRSRT